MPSKLKLIAASSMLIGGLAFAAFAQQNVPSSPGSDHGMMGGKAGMMQQMSPEMTQQMTRMMENCNRMMESHMQQQQQPTSTPQPEKKG